MRSTLPVLLRAALPGLAFLCGAAAGDWQIGSHKMGISGPGASPLLERPAGPAGLASRRFLLEIGGVDFEAVASTASPITLRYDPGAPDGQRLIVQADGVATHAALPDWQIKPIAALADSVYTADVSLFGDGPDTDHFVYPRFHPALRDTLLGLRLLQADLMLSHPESFRQVPMQNGSPVLGVGEAMPNDAASAHAADVLGAVIGSYDYQSWVLTDIGENAALQSEAGGVRPDLHPFYYFWSTRIGAAALRLLRLTSLEGLVSKPEQPGIRAQVEAAARRYEVLERQPETSGQPHAMPDLTARVQADEAMVRALNPLVWNAVQNTSRYAALFRLARTDDPAAWRAFTASLANVPLVPAVRTPTAWPRED